MKGGKKIFVEQKQTSPKLDEAVISKNDSFR